MNQHGQQQQDAGPDKQNQVVKRVQHIPCTAPDQALWVSESAELHVEDAPGGKRAQHRDTTNGHAEQTVPFEGPDEKCGRHFAAGKTDDGNRHDVTQQQQTVEHKAEQKPCRDP